MRAVMLTAAGDVRLGDVAMIQDDPGDIVVDVVMAGVCGSDLNAIRDPAQRRLPIVLGHEAVGVTADGRRVAINPIIGCGNCARCGEGRSALCDHRAVLGNQRPGVFADQVAVPEANLIEIPDGLDWLHAVLIEPLATAAHAWALTGRDRNARVGVIGAGALGTLLLLVLLEEVDDVTVVDVDPGRLDVARALGAPVTGVELEGRFDVVFDVVGLTATRMAAVTHLAPGGDCVMLGLHDQQLQLDVATLIRNENRVLGSFAYADDDFATAVRLAPQLDLGWVSTHAIDDAPQLLRDMSAGARPTTKLVFSL